MKKLLIRLVIVAVILLVLAIISVRLFLDGAIKKGVETIGPKIAKVDIKLDSVNLSLLTGSGKVKGLIVGNPEGYKSPSAISVGNTGVSLSPGSLLSDKIVVHSIRVEAPEITLELGSGGNNLSKILANVQATVGGSGGKSAPKEPGTPKEQKPGKKLQVDEFLITGAKVSLGASALGGTAAQVTVPEILLTNLGSGPDGITSAELTGIVLAAVEKAALEAAGPHLEKLGKSALDAAAKGAGRDAEKAAKDITDMLQKKKK